jgi:DNA-binding MarR family transcriptional regulator
MGEGASGKDILRDETTIWIGIAMGRPQTDEEAQKVRSATRLSDRELAAWRGMLRVHSALFRQLDAELEAVHQLPLRSYDVLVVLESAPEHRMRMTDLSRSVLLSPSGVSRLVDRLEAEGLVCRERCTSDGRGFFAHLTDDGERRLLEARATHLSGVRRLFLDHFDKADLERLAAFWRRVEPGAVDD